jgi:hypothetical protein
VSETTARRRDGSLWSCGHPVAATVKDPQGVVVCAKCSGLPVPVLAEKRLPR